MPELPEVEVTRRGIAPLVTHRAVTGLTIRERRLRWPISRGVARELPGRAIDEVARRGKYLLFRTTAGTMIVHLGMSGSLRVIPTATPVDTHDHIDVVLDDGQCLRLHDPRRFGAVLWTRRDPARHRLIAHLGPEPLAAEFDGEYLYEAARGRRAPVKHFLMDARIVVGLGNIYANEALFAAGIHPRRPAGRISAVRYTRLAGAIKQVLGEAITAGGTTLRDFRASDGRPGYFARYLRSYARADEPCPQCGTPIRQLPLGQRSTFYCVRCQR